MVVLGGRDELTGVGERRAAKDLAFRDREKAVDDIDVDDIAL